MFPFPHSHNPRVLGTRWLRRQLCPHHYRPPREAALGGKALDSALHTLDLRTCGTLGRGPEESWVSGLNLGKVGATRNAPSEAIRGHLQQDRWWS